MLWDGGGEVGREKVEQRYCGRKVVMSLEESDFLCVTLDGEKRTLSFHRIRIGIAINLLIKFWKHLQSRASWSEVKSGGDFKLISPSPTPLG